MDFYIFYTTPNEARIKATTSPQKGTTHVAMNIPGYPSLKVSPVTARKVTFGPACGRESRTPADIAAILCNT